MELSSILMIVGIIVIILSLFLKDKSVQVEKDVEDLSINIYQETNALKRRIKLLEEELLVEPNFQVKQPETNQTDAFTSFQKVADQMKTAQHNSTQSGLKSEKNNKPINGILVSQVLALNNQGLSIDEISKLSTLSHAQIQSILANGGKQ
ncbi:MULTISPECIES: hypothetical protein [Solibacillus]|uniref:Uncharacterized protein n=1 Tax=Solibacillus merdavium TaxID=2762218 RepID=A0ABR8XRP1_9BACL|nr:hypothetical protein [Solibacillus merdavium]MBD8034524.1 hypothetical protein [Solibacillus merdavium]